MHALVTILFAATIAAAPRTWNDSIRDVYIDGRLDRSAQTLAAASPRMIAVLCGEEVLLLDPETKAVSRVARSRFTFAADRTTATSEGAPEPAGTLVSPEDRKSVV
jgi:hypothetical protein